MKNEVIVTCEHASRAVPPQYRSLFRGHQRVLRSHRGYDPNSIELATELATRLQCKLLQGTTSRLLVEINRSLRHPALFSEFTRPLSKAERQRLLDEYYIPYRTAVEREIRSHVARGQTVLQLSIHTFTPIINGISRATDIGLLYDPAREPEMRWMRAWQEQLSRDLPELRTRRNYPYQGRSDGLTTSLRKKFAPQDYLGIEIEVRNSLLPASAVWNRLAAILAGLAREFRLA